MLSFKYKIWWYYYAIYFGCIPIPEKTKIYPAHPNAFGKV